MKTPCQILLLLVAATLVAKLPAQEVSIPDPGLNAAIREALHKPAGPLTVQDMMSLTNLNAAGRQVADLEGLGAANNLIYASLRGNQLSGNVAVPTGLTNLNFLRLGYNQIGSLFLPADLTSLTMLEVNDNALTTFTLPAGLTNLSSLDLGGNQLTNVSLPAGLTSLVSLDLGYGLGAPCANHLTDLSFLKGLTNLVWLNLSGNCLTSLTLPPGLTSLTELRLDGNQLTIFVVPEELAQGSMAAQVASLRSQGVSVYTYPTIPSLGSPARTISGAFEFVLTGPPGTYSILGSADLVAWRESGALTNRLGTAVFTDSPAIGAVQNFYRARSAP
jgi:Leucine-rich repeat (LRR) protein